MLPSRIFPSYFLFMKRRLCIIKVIKSEISFHGVHDKLQKYAEAVNLIKLNMRYGVSI